jgi:hypothetical protein
MKKTNVIISGGGFGAVYAFRRCCSDDSLRPLWTSFATTFFTQRNQAHRELLSRDVAHREELYSQFIKGATNL